MQEIEKMLWKVDVNIWCSVASLAGQALSDEMQIVQHSDPLLPIRGVESVIGSMSPTIVEKIVIASRIVTPEKWLPGKSSLY